MPANEKECHFVEVSPIWEPLLQDQQKVQMMTEEVYHLMVDPNYPETELTLDQLKTIYNDPEAAEVSVREGLGLGRHDLSIVRAHS